MNWLQDCVHLKVREPWITLGTERWDRDHPAAETDSDSDASESPNPLRLLLVDDDRLSRIMTANLLRANNIEVSQAENGLDALMQCQTRAFDVVLTDLRMPIMDGETLAYRLRRFEIENARPACRIVALAASLSPLGSTEDDIRAEGTFDAALEKPALIGDVLNAILG
ncbi:MAG: response regulator [Burkholderiaceae bacterium]